MTWLSWSSNLELPYFHFHEHQSVRKPVKVPKRSRRNVLRLMFLKGHAAGSGKC